MTNNIEEQFLIEEYSKCWDSLNHTDNLFWKIPSIAITIVSIVFGILFLNLENIPIELRNFIIIGITIILMLFLIGFLIDLIKMRKYLVWRFEVCREIENKLLKNLDIKLKLANYGNSKRNEKKWMEISIMQVIPIVIILLMAGTIIIAIYLYNY